MPALNEIELTRSDRERIKVDIRLTLTLGLLLIMTILGIIVLIQLLLFLISNGSAEIFSKSGVLIVAGAIILYVAVTWKGLIKYADLKGGKKINFKTNDYKIEKTVEGLVLVTESPVRLKLNLHKGSERFIHLTDPLVVEISKLSKTLLFVSHDGHNLLEKLEVENE